MGNKHKNHNKHHSGNGFNNNSENVKPNEELKDSVVTPEENEEVNNDAPQDQTTQSEKEESTDNISEVNSEPGGEEACEEEEDKIKKLEEEVAKEKKEYLFLMAEFDNFRKRTIREKSEIIKNAGENVLKGLLPIMDDFERGMKATESSPEDDAVKEGFVLIYNKLKKFLEQNGVREIDPEDRNFDTEKHEAITAIPAPSEEQKGKIIDTVEKGYTINDKVLRHAKVVVGQ